MSSGLRSTSSSPSRKSMRPFSGKDSLELQRRNPSRAPASAGMHGGSLTMRDGFLLIVRHLSAAIVSREGGRGHWAAATGCRRREARPGRAPGTRAARWVYTRPTEIRSRGMLAPRWDTRRLVAWLALAATIGGGAACSGGSGGGAAPLRLVFHSGPQGLDPHLHDEAATHWVLYNVYDSLVTFDADIHVRPALASGWDNPDDLTWRFRLRPGVHFQDGRPLAAADVVVSLERARSHPRSKMSGYLVEVAAVRAVDPLTVEVQTRRPYPILLNKLTFIAIVPRDAPPLIAKPVGTGPYRFVAYAPGRSLELAAFGNGWPPREDGEPRESIGFESGGARGEERVVDWEAGRI